MNKIDATPPTLFLCFFRWFCHPEFEKIHRRRSDRVVSGAIGKIRKEKGRFKIYSRRFVTSQTWNYQALSKVIR